MAAVPHRARIETTRPRRAIESAVDAAVAAALWIEPTDRPKVDVTLALARKIDDRLWHAEHVAAASLFPDAALGEVDGGLTYDLDVLGRLLDSLGLSPKGRRELGIDTDEEEHDDLAHIVNLHR